MAPGFQHLLRETQVAVKSVQHHHPLLPWAAAAADFGNRTSVRAVSPASPSRWPTIATARPVRRFKPTDARAQDPARKPRTA